MYLTLRLQGIGAGGGGFGLYLEARYIKGCVFSIETSRYWGQGVGGLDCTLRLGI